MQKEILSLKSPQTIPGIRGIKRSREVIDTPLSGHDLNNESDQENAIDTFWEQNATEAPEGENSENEWMDISEFFETCTDTGEELKIELASIANTVLCGKVREEKSNTLQIKHKRPKNVENLQVPRVDEILWGRLRRETKAFDYAMKKSQSMLCHTLVPTLKLMQLQKDGGKIAECRELTTDIFKILAQGVVKSNEWRKERVRQDLVPMYKSLCDRETSVNKLFGDKLQEEIKHLKETKTMLVPNSNKKPFLARRGRGQNNNNNNNRQYYYRNQASASFPLQNKINRRGRNNYQSQYKKAKTGRK